MDDKDGVSIHMGFPNPAADRTLQGLDLHTLLVKNPASTFFMRIAGRDWEDRGIFDTDVVIIDRALSPKPTDLVIITKEADFLIAPSGTVPEDGVVWGTVTAVIHQYR